MTPADKGIAAASWTPNADELERLRAENARLRTALETLIAVAVRAKGRHYTHLQAPITTARTVLAQATGERR